MVQMPVWMTQKPVSLTQVFYSESTKENSQRAGQYGLADSKCEGYSRVESGGKGRRAELLAEAHVDR